jgi:hypothetical protein
VFPRTELPRHQPANATAAPEPLEKVTSAQISDEIDVGLSVVNAPSSSPLSACQKRRRTVVMADTRAVPFAALALRRLIALTPNR